MPTLVRVSSWGPIPSVSLFVRLLERLGKWCPLLIGSLRTIRHIQEWFTFRERISTSLLF